MGWLTLMGAFLRDSRAWPNTRDKPYDAVGIAPARALRVTQGERESSVAQRETLAKSVAGIRRPDRLVNNSVQLLTLRDLGTGVLHCPEHDRA
jgi:hypothetical protein